MFPHLVWDISGGGELAPARVNGWRLLTIFRSHACELSHDLLGWMELLRSDFEAAGVALMAVSADGREASQRARKDQGWGFPVAHGLSAPDIARLGLYSSPDPSRPGRAIAEPGLFLLNPAGETVVCVISNSAYGRPDLEMLLDACRYFQEEDRLVCSNS